MPPSRATSKQVALPTKKATKASKKPVKVKKIEITNYDEEIPKDLGLQSRQSRYDHAPKHPSRVLICGPSGCGKSNLLLNLLLKLMVYDKLYIFAKDVSEDKYQYLQARFQEVARLMEKQTGKNVPLNMIFVMSTDTKDLPKLEYLDPTQQAVFVFDDFVNDKEQKVIEDLYIRGRKRNCTSIYLSQSFHDVPKVVRLNCNYLFLFNVGSKREFTEIAKTFASDIEVSDFRKMYQSAVSEPFSFLLIDMTKPMSQINRKYRAGFNRFACIKDQ
jgi:Poxvirus A32 protein